MKYPTKNSNYSEGVPLELLEATPWAEFLHSIAKNGTCGDQITLQAAADLYNIAIFVVSTLGPDATGVISSFSSIPLQEFSWAIMQRTRESTTYVWTAECCSKRRSSRRR